MLYKKSVKMNLYYAVHFNQLEEIFHNGFGRYNISEWEYILNNEKPLSLIIIHNHTIETLFSFDDLYTFLFHESLKASIITVSDFAYILDKSESSKCNWESIEQEFKIQFPGEDYFKTDNEWDISKIADFWMTVLKKFHIELRRWA